MGFFKTLWNFVKKPVEIVGNIAGNALGLGDTGSMITGGVDSTIHDSMQQQAINKQLEGTKYAADQSLQGQREANQTNIDIMRETNAHNLQLSQMQNEWNLEQWNRQNEYNSPSNQMKLMKQAGLNPVLSQGSFSPAQSLESAPLAVNQPTHVDNPAGVSSQIMAQGVTAASSIMKDSALNTAQTALAQAQTKNTYFNTHRGEVLLGEELNNLSAQNEKLLAEKGRIIFLTPVEKQNLLVNNQKMQIESEWLIQQAKTEKEKRRYQKAIADAAEINTSILDHTQHVLKKLPAAQLRLTLAQAFHAIASGNYEKFQTDYMKNHGHTVPNDAFMLLTSYLTSDPDFVSNLRKLASKLGKNSGSAADAAGKASDKISKLADKLADIINDPVGSLSHFCLTLDPFGIFLDEPIDLLESK